MDISLLEKNFSACSANDKAHKHLWLKSANLFIPQVNKLLNINTRSKLKIYDISHFNTKSEKLERMFNKYGTDKSTVHNYHIIYSHIFNKLGRNNKLNILELGIGTNNPDAVSTMGKHGKPGASLRAYKDYLPNARIYGADIDKNILFAEPRIKTTYVDQLNYYTLHTMYKTFKAKKYDVVIDDGLHAIGANLNTLIFGLQNVKKNGWIVIEDINEKYLENWRVVDFIILQNSDLQTYMVKTKKAYMYLVNL